MHRLSIACALLVAACTQTVADSALRACEPLCQCADVPLPGAQRDCVTTCSAQFERMPLSEVCVTCIAEHADRCTSLVDDCAPICAQAVPLSSYVDTAPPSRPEAEP